MFGILQVIHLLWATHSLGAVQSLEPIWMGQRESLMRNCHRWGSGLIYRTKIIFSGSKVGPLKMIERAEPKRDLYWNKRFSCSVNKKNIIFWTESNACWENLLLVLYKWSLNRKGVDISKLLNPSLGRAMFIGAANQKEWRLMCGVHHKWDVSRFSLKSDYGTQALERAE